jgi:ferredoxin
LPEVVAIDDWGYPVVTAEVDDDLVRLAREAVVSCPHLALRLVSVPPASLRGTQGGRR